jgi:hypothetical protein
MNQDKQAIDFWQYLTRRALTANTVLPLEPASATVVASPQSINPSLDIQSNSHSFTLMRRECQYVGSTESSAAWLNSICAKHAG